MEAGIVIWLILLALWVLFGLWGKSIMESKGRSGGAGLALGLGLGFVGIILCALMGPSAEYQARRIAEAHRRHSGGR